MTGEGTCFAAQADADVAVEQAVAVAVFGDQQQAALEPGRGAAEAAGAGAGFGQQLFDAGVEAARTLRAGAYGGEQAQARGIAQGGGGVVCISQRAPVREQCVAAQGQRVLAVFVEVHAGQFAAA